jgi:sugar O-acyltransferase (sialic acid O-acetyltransferase NeuD family)
MPARQAADPDFLMDTPRDLIVIGGGEHARVVIEAARSRPDLWNVLGFADPLPCTETSERLDIRWLGDDEVCFQRAAANWFVMGVGSVGPSPLRDRVAAEYENVGVRWATVIHARAWVSPTAVLGRGVVVLAGAEINTGAVIGDHCVINTGATIEHDVRLRSFTQVGPGATVGGGAVVEDHSYLGLGCCVRDHVTIGHHVTVAMGAVVVGPIPAEDVVMGVPAKPMKVGRSNG